MRPAAQASLMFFVGLLAQGVGLYLMGGLGIALPVVGTELAALGLVGVFRAG
jgi:hypothetical protein